MGTAMTALLTERLIQQLTRAPRNLEVLRTAQPPKRVEHVADHTVGGVDIVSRDVVPDFFEIGVSSGMKRETWL